MRVLGWLALCRVEWGNISAGRNGEALNALNLTVHWTCLKQMNAFKTHFSVHFMFVCGVMSSNRESTVVPEIFTVLRCFTRHRFIVICWTAGPLKVGLIGWSKTSLTTRP